MVKNCSSLKLGDIVSVYGNTKEGWMVLDVNLGELTNKFEFTGGPPSEFLVGVSIILFTFVNSISYYSFNLGNYGK